MSRPEPRGTITNRVIVPDQARMRHQENWPEVEATVRVTVRQRESWGITSVTHAVVARAFVDIREGGMTREALDKAQRDATNRAQIWAARVEQDNEI